MFYRFTTRSKKMCDNLEEEFKLIYGMLFSLKRFIALTSPRPYVFHNLDTMTTMVMKMA